MVCELITHLKFCKAHSWQITYIQYFCVVFSIVRNVPCLDQFSKSRYKFNKKITSQDPSCIFGSQSTLIIWKAIETQGFAQVTLWISNSAEIRWLTSLSLFLPHLLDSPASINSLHSLVTRLKCQVEFILNCLSHLWNVNSMIKFVFNHKSSNSSVLRQKLIAQQAMAAW